MFPNSPLGKPTANVLSAIRDVFSVEVIPFLRCRGRRHQLVLTPVEQRAVNPEVIVRHSPGEKAPLKCLPDLMSIQPIDPAQRRDGFGLVINDKSRRAVLHDLGHRSAPERDHWGAARHCFDHHEPERLRPLNRKE